MKDIIIDIIILLNGKANFRTLEKRLNIDSSTLEKIILELKLDGKILETDGKYSLFPEEMLIGSISTTKNGNKVIFYNGSIISVASNFFNTVILNDVVSYFINEKGEAVITSIIERKIRNVTCKVISNGKKKKVECFHKGIEITLPKNILNNLSIGDIVLVEIGINEYDSGYCPCTFKKVIGNVSEPNIDEINIAINYGFDNIYSDEFMEEVTMLPTEVSEDECIGRTDLRNLPFVTIDCATAKDMDDAVYVVPYDDGYRVYVSISDVSHYIKYGSKIFERALEKGNSYYSNNIVFHMLHPIISNGICSLNPDEDRLTKTVIMDIDKNGKVIDFNITKSVIRSRKKMTYDEVDQIIVDGTIPEGYEAYVELIRNLHQVALLLEHRAKNVDGKVDFPNDELEKKYDEFGNIIEIKQMEDTPARRLIEYLMIEANKCVASYVLWSTIPSAYRNHAMPDIIKVNNTLKAINENDDIPIKVKQIDSVKDPKVIQAILHQLSNLDEYPILAGLLLQSMQRAEYNTENIGHYALGISTYTHFTSPIRRLCDLLVHTILDILLTKPELISEIDFEELEKFLQESCKQASRMERQADAGEKEAERLEIIKSMEKYIGCEFEGIVLEVGDRIKVKVNGIDAFVKYKYLSQNFNFDEETGKYYDKHNGKVLRIGAPIIVRLDSVNLNTRIINLDILGIIDSKKLTKK